MNSNDNIDNGLLGFLQRKSLFQPEHSRLPSRRKNSRHEDKDSIIKRINDQQLQQPSTSPLQTHYPPNNLNHTQSPQRPTYRDNNSVFHSLRTSPQPYRKPSESRFANLSTYSPLRAPDSWNQDFRREPDNVGRIIQEVTNFSMNFQSARLQSSQCLESMSFKLKTQLSNINYRIDEFRSRMGRTLSQQFRTLRERILKMVEESFRQSQRAVKEYMQIEEKMLAGDLLRLRDSLDQQLFKVQRMKQEINKPHWRKVAGEILSTQLQQNIEQLILKTSTTSVNAWHKRQWNQQHIVNMGKCLKELMWFRET